MLHSFITVVRDRVSDLYITRRKNTLKKRLSEDYSEKTGIEFPFGNILKDFDVKSPLSRCVEEDVSTFDWI